MARGMDRLAADLTKWAAKLSNSGYGSPTERDVLDFRAARATALYLMRDVRPDIERRVGGRTLDSGKGKKARGPRAGVWAAAYGGATSWWVGGSGKLHWIDEGTSSHLLTAKKRGRKKRGKTPAPLVTPWGPRVGPFRHPGSRGDHIYFRSVGKHQQAAMDFTGAKLQGEIVRMVMPQPDQYRPGEF